jgi:hypothetical protein
VGEEKTARRGSGSSGRFLTLEMGSWKNNIRGDYYFDFLISFLERMAERYPHI